MSDIPVIVTDISEERRLFLMTRSHLENYRALLIQMGQPRDLVVETLEQIEEWLAAHPV